MSAMARFAAAGVLGPRHHHAGLHDRADEEVRHRVDRRLRSMRPIAAATASTALMVPNA